MRTSVIFLSSTPLSADQSTELSAAPIKGRTQVTLDMTGMDEASYAINDIKIDWGDANIIYEYKRDPVKDYTATSIFDELLYGKMGGSIATRYEHIFTSLSSIDIITYLIQVFAYAENGYRHDYVIYLPVFPESYYDSLDELDILTTQMLPLSTNDTVVNMASGKSGQTLICVLSS